MAASGESDELDQLRTELAASREENERLRHEADEGHAEIRDLRAAARRDEAEISAIQDDAAESSRIERAQQALIEQLRREAGERVHEIVDIGDRLFRAETELNDLRAIRDALIEPTLIQRDGMTIAAEIIPSDTQVGGDFYFVGDGPEHTAVMAIGDVVGKGLAAARRCAFTRTAFASVAPFSDDPCQLLRWVNAALVERIGESAEFVTAACLTYDPTNRVLRYGAAGHHPSCRLDSGVEITASRNGIALGLTRELSCVSRTDTIEAGAGVLMFTDGLTEAGDRRDRFGSARVTEFLRSHPHLSPEETLHRLRDLARRHAGGQLGDDVGLLAMRAQS